MLPREYKPGISAVETPVCHVFGAGEYHCHNNGGFYNSGFRKKPRDFLIAADGGFKHLRALGITPDLLVGDFDSLDSLDSLENIPKTIETIKYPAVKDDTDMLLSVKQGLLRGYEVFAIYGGTGGGRVSHTIANISLLAWLCGQNAQGFLIDGSTQITAIKNGRVCYSAADSGYISVFAFGGIAGGVSVSGLKYTLENASLTPENPLGVSNAFVNKEAEISVQNGCLIIVTEMCLP